MKKIICTIMSAAILFMSGCSSAHEPVTTIPLYADTTTVGDVAGTIEGDRYISHAGGIAYKLTGDYTAEWVDTDKRDILMNDYTGIDLAGPFFVWDNRGTLTFSYILDEQLQEDAKREHTLEEWNSSSKYPVKSIEYTDDYKIDGKSGSALKMVIDKNGYDVSTLQIYFFQDNGVLILITITAASFKEADKIAKNIQLA